MLGKLFKYEWKSVSRIGGLLLLIAGGITILGMITVRLSFGHVMMDEDSAMGALTAVLGVMGFMIFCLCLASISYGIFIYLGVRFYKTMYGDEGYLTHTLPVTNHQLLLSKILVGGIWSILVALTMALAMLLFVASFAGTATIADGSWWVGFADVWRGIFETFADMDAGSKARAVIVLLLFLLTAFASIAGLYGSITMGQLFKKHRGLMAIICYFVYLFVVWLIGFVGGIFMSINLALLSDESDVLTSYMDTYIIGQVVILIMGVVMYFVAHYINEQKLNME
ncbi:MAG: hypothetical protein IJ833_09645 [Lachnospiraceae bacterium]|nr:hypothetical protein [Lachnospiraceae bacterium]